MTDLSSLFSDFKPCKICNGSAFPLATFDENDEIVSFTVKCSRHCSEDMIMCTGKVSPESVSQVKLRWNLRA